MTREVQIALGDSHRVANLFAIGDQLFAAKTDRARRGRGAGSELQEATGAFSPVNRADVEIVRRLASIAAA